MPTQITRLSVASRPAVIRGSRCDRRLHYETGFSPLNARRPLGTRRKSLHYYEAIDLETARKAQVILAYEMNGAPLPLEHGALLRLRVEPQLGYKMAKWVNRIELVADCQGIGKGHGGWRDDVLNYNPSDAGI